MKPFLFFCFSFLSVFLFSACESRQPLLSHKLKKGCDYYSLQTAQCLDTTHLLNKLKPYPVIFIGDHHTEAALHKNIADLINALSQSGYTVHLANEWFYPSDDKTLKSFSDKATDEELFLKDIQWEKRLKYYPYDSFKPIYESVRQNGGTLYGINLSKEERVKISELNLSSMSKNELDFYHGLDLDVIPHKELVMPYLSHCHAPKKNESLQECIQRMYRVQVAWDSKMALESYKLSQRLKENEKLLVFAGSVHIENGLGIPLRFARLSDLPTLSIIPVESKRQNVSNDLADYLLFYPEKEPK